MHEAFLMLNRLKTAAPRIGLLTVVLFALSSVALAQEEHPSVTHVDQGIEDLFSRAARFERKGRFAKAAQTYLLAQDTLMKRRRKNPERRYVTKVSEELDWGLEQAISQRIAALPLSGKKAYLLVVEPRARAALSAAQKSRSLSALQILINRYPYAPSTITSMSLLADWSLEQGQVNLAASTYLRLAAALPKDASLHFGRAARCYQLVKDAAGLRFVGSQLKKSGLKADAALKKILASAGEVGHRAVEISPLPRLGRLEATGKISRPEMTKEMADHFKVLPAYQIPVVMKEGSETFVYMSDSKTVRAYRLSETLQNWWDFTVGGPDAEPERLGVMRNSPTIVGSRLFATLNRNRPAKRIRKKVDPKAKLIPEPKPEKNVKDKSKDPDELFEIKQAKNWRVVALDRRTGTVLWDLADNDEFERFSRYAEWISSPAYSDGFIYLTVTLFKNALHSYLLKLDSQSGKLSWVAELTSRTPTNHRGLAGPLSKPVIRGGMAYIGTGLGLIATVETANGRLVWAYHYPVFPDRSQSTIIDEDRRFAVHSPLILKSKGLVILAPVDGPYLIALNRETGALVWKRPRAAARFVVHKDERLLLVGKTLTEIDPQSGLVKAQSEALPGTAAAAPLWGDDSLIVPTLKGFVRFSSDDLTKEGLFEVKDKEEVGPLFRLNEKRFVALTARRFNIYGSVERTLNEFDRPGSFARWFERGLLNERRGEFEKSAKGYARALKTPAGKQDPERRLQASKALFKVLWRFAEKRMKTDKGDAFSQLSAQLLNIAEKTESMADQSGTAADQTFLYQAALFKKRLGELLEGRENFKDALVSVKAYQSLLDRRPRLKLEHKGIWVDSKAFASERLRVLILKHSRKVYRDQDALANRLGNEAITNKSSDSMLAVISRYPVSKISTELRYQLAQFYNERFLHSLSTEALEDFLSEAPNDSKAARAMALLAATLKKRNRDHDAKQVALEMLSRFQGDKVPDANGNMIRVRDFVRGLISDLRIVKSPLALAQKDRAADLRKPLRSSFRLEMDLNGSGTKALEVGPYEQLRHFFLKRETSLEARLADGGLLAWSIPEVPSFTKGCGPRASNGILAVPLAGEVLGVPINSGGVRWRFTPKDLGKATNFSGDRTVIAVTGDERFFYVLTKWSEFLCLNPKTGKVVWKSAIQGRVSERIVARGGQVFVGTNLPASVNEFDRKTGKLVSITKLSNNFRSEHRGPLLMLEKILIAQVGRNQLVSVDLTTKKLLFEKQVVKLGQIKKVFTSKDESGIYVLGSQQLGDRVSFLALHARTGLERWSDDGRGRVKGLGRKYANSTKIRQVYCGDRAIYTVRREGLEKTQVWAQDLITGASQWTWRCPPGQGPQTIIETPGQLMIPYGGQLGRCSLSIVAKGAGQTIDTYRVPGRKVVSTSVAAGTLLVMTDRGQFAFARMRDSLIAREVVEMVNVLRSQKTAEPLLAALLADRLQKAGSIDPAVELLAKSLLAESLDPKDFRLLYSKLVTLLEVQVEKKQPKMSIHRISRPAEIDGELNDWWRDWSSVVTKGPTHVLPIQGMKGGEGAFWRGQEDLSAKLYMAYDDRNFYFALDVRDQDLRPFDSDAKRWIGDCLLIAIDCKNNGGLWYNRDDILLSLALTRPRKKDKNKKNPKSKKEREAEKKKGRPMGKYFVKRKEDHSGVIYECKIPWAMFEKYGVTIDPKNGPPKGFSFGFNFVLTDDDGGRRGDGKNNGALKTLSWTPSLRLHADRSRIWQGYIPEYFGKITLD
jgi:outer membrane protein assembly factor BamB